MHNDPRPGLKGFEPVCAIKRSREREPSGFDFGLFVLILSEIVPVQPTCSTFYNSGAQLVAAKLTLEHLKINLGAKKDFAARANIPLKQSKSILPTKIAFLPTSSFLPSFSH